MYRTVALLLVLLVATPATGQEPGGDPNNGGEEGTTEGVTEGDYVELPQVGLMNITGHITEMVRILGGMVAQFVGVFFLFATVRYALPWIEACDGTDPSAMRNDRLLYKQGGMTAGEFYDKYGEAAEDYGDYQFDVNKYGDRNIPF